MSVSSYYNKQATQRYPKAAEMVSCKSLIGRL